VKKHIDERERERQTDRENGGTLENSVDNRLAGRLLCMCTSSTVHYSVGICMYIHMYCTLRSALL